MKQPSKLTSRQEEVPDLDVWVFIRMAFGLTLGVALPIMLMTVSLPASDPWWEVWSVSAFLVIVPIWVGTLFVACLVLIPVWTWRLIKGVVKNGGKFVARERLWDRWMDGPGPL